MLETIVCIIQEGMIYMPTFRPNYGATFCQSPTQMSSWGGTIHNGFIVFPLTMCVNKWLAGFPPSAAFSVDGNTPCAVLLDRLANTYLLYDCSSFHRKSLDDKDKEEDKEWKIIAIPTKGCLGHRYVFSNNPAAQVAVDSVLDMGVHPVNALDILSLYIYFPSRRLRRFEMLELAKLLDDCMNGTTTPQEAFPVVAGLLEYKPLS